MAAGRDGQGDGEPLAEIGEIGGEVVARFLPDPCPNPAHAHLTQVLEARRVLLAQGIAIVEGAFPLLRVARAVEEQAGPALRGKTRESVCELEEERDLLAAIEGAARIVPAVPRESGGQTEPLPQAVREPEGQRAREIEDPESAGK